MKFSVFSVSMPELDIEQTVKFLNDFGFNGVEWRVNTPSPKEKSPDYTHERRYWTNNLSTLDIGNIEEEAIRAKELCDTYKLDIVSLTTYLRPHEVESVEKVLKAAQSIGCPNIRVFPPNYDEKESYPSLFARTVEELKVLEPLALKYKVRINLEIHMGNIIPSASAAYRLVSHFDPKAIGIIYDPGNMVHEGFENYKLGFELLDDYLAYVHVKNALWEKAGVLDNGSQIWKPIWTPLKKGCANLTKLIATLREMGYNGYISIEDFSNEEDTVSKLRNNLAYLKGL